VLVISAVAAVLEVVLHKAAAAAGLHGHTLLANK
jgi:hypothetical protein